MQPPLNNEERARTPKSSGETPGLGWELLPVVPRETSRLSAQLQRTLRARSVSPKPRALPSPSPASAPHPSAPPEHHPGAELLLFPCHPSLGATQLPAVWHAGLLGPPGPSQQRPSPRLMPGAAPRPEPSLGVWANTEVFPIPGAGRNRIAYVNGNPSGRERKEKNKLKLKDYQKRALARAGQGQSNAHGRRALISPHPERQLWRGSHQLVTH